MLFGARFFVFVLYLLLGISFIAETALLFWEFGPADALVLATHDSHLFLFFPTLGLVALAAFYRPSCAFVDMYWRHVRFGKLRFVVGFTITMIVAYVAGMHLAASPYRSVWDLNPMALAADSSEPVGCGSATKPCQRIGILEGVQNVAKVSHQRLGLKEFVRSCEVETLLENDAATERKRFCFASTPLTSTPRLTTDAECCRAQLSYQQAISDLYRKSHARSLTGVVHAALLPAKVLFMLVLLVISILLAARHAGVTHSLSRPNPAHRGGRAGRRAGDAVLPAHEPGLCADNECALRSASGDRVQAHRAVHELHVRSVGAAAAVLLLPPPRYRA